MALNNEIDGSDDEINPTAHKQLLAGVSNLTKTQHIKKPVRLEPSLKRSEFHLVKTTTDELKPTKQTAVFLDEVAKDLQKTKKSLGLVKALNSVRKTGKKIHKPLERVESERIEREEGYRKAKKKLSRWESVVTTNRSAEHMEFPLQERDLRIEFGKRQDPTDIKIKSDLMIQMEALLPTKEELGQTVSKEDDDMADKNLTKAELMAKRREIRRLKILESSKIVKQRMQNKIKSKKYHRILKKEKLRKQLKEFETLQQSNPDAALDKLEELEMNRVLERANLRHKNTGTWAKNLQVRAKYDKDVRKDLAQQLAISRQLTEKNKNDESEAESEDNDANENAIDEIDPFNPWMKKKTDKPTEVDEFVTSYKQYWEERNKNEEQLKALKPKLESDDESIDDDESDSDEEIAKTISQPAVQTKKVMKKTPTKIKESKQAMVNKSTVKKRKSINDFIEEDCDSNGNPIEINKLSKVDNVDDLFDEAEDMLLNKFQEKMKQYKNNETKSNGKNSKRKSKANDNVEEYRGDLSFKPSKKRAILDETLNETDGRNEGNHNEIDDIKSIAQSKLVDEPKKESDDINPNNFLNIKPKFMKTRIQEDVEINDDALDDEDDADGTTFESQKLTIAQAFEDDDIVADFDKDREDERKRNENEDVDMTLPGWGSWAGQGIKKPTRRLILKFPEANKRKDDKKPNVIINENINPLLKSHLVSKLPYPFTKVADYEASIRAPISNTFIPELSFREITRPAIETKSGKVITPMNEEILLKTERRSGPIKGTKFLKKSNSKVRFNKK